MTRGVTAHEDEAPTSHETYQDPGEALRGSTPPQHTNAPQGNEEGHRPFWPGGSQAQPRQASRRRGAGSSKSTIDRQRHEEVCHRIRKQIERWADIEGKHVYRTLHLACRYNGFTGVYCAVRIRIIDRGGLHGLHPGGIALLVCKGNGTLREAHPFSCRTETHLEYRLSLQRE